MKPAISRLFAAEGIVLLVAALVVSAVSLGCSGLSGGKSGQLTVSATNLNFGNVSVGATNTRTVAITNTGTTDVTLTQNASVGASFSASGIGTGLILDSGKTATLEVSFAPVSAGIIRGSVPLVSDAWQNPMAIALSGNGVEPSGRVATLMWNPSQSTTAGYNAYRATQSGGPYTRLNPIPVTQTSYEDSTVTSGREYFYVVTAVNDRAEESAYSNEVSADIP